MTTQEDLKKLTFENPSVVAALKGMTKEQREAYKKIGEEMYGKIDFEDSKLMNNIPFTDEALFYITEAIKSGLHAKDLAEDEKNFMINMYGDVWYEKWGFTKEDMQ